MTPTHWCVALFCALSLAMKRAHTTRSLENEPDLDLVAALPLDMLQYQFLPIMNACSLLVMMMTSRKNFVIFKALLVMHVKNPKNQLVEEFFDLAPSSGKKSPEYYMMKNLMSRTWPGSHDCLLRYRLRLSHYAVIVKANNLPFASPYPVFFSHEKEMPYVQVPGSGSLGSSALRHRVYNRYSFNADLLQGIPIQIINELSQENSSCLINMHDHKCETLVHNKELMKRLVKLGLHDYFITNSDDLFKRLLDPGLDGIASDEEINSDCGNDDTTLALLLHEANDSNTDKVKNILEQFDFDDIEMEAHAFFASNLDTLVILDRLYDDEQLDILLIYSKLMDGGRKAEINWYSDFYAEDEITLIIDSYSEEFDSFAVEFYGNEPSTAALLFVAVLQNASDNLIKALIRRSHLPSAIGAFFFLLVSGRNEELIRYMMKTQKEFFYDVDSWETVYYRSIPSNVDIPHTLLPDMILYFPRLLLPFQMIPDPDKYVAALKYIEEHNLWTADFSLFNVVHSEIKSPHPIVFQAVLDLATKKDFCGLALEPIFSDLYLNIASQTLETAQQRLPVMEYLRTVPLAKLVEAIEKAGPQNPDILNPTSNNFRKFSMLPLVYRTVFAHPRASPRITIQKYSNMHRAIIDEAWRNIFPGTLRPSTPNCFFKLVEELDRENLKALSIIYPIAFCSLSTANQADIGYPEGFTFKQKSVAQKVLAEVVASVTAQVLINWIVINKCKPSNPLTEAAFKGLLRRPKGLIHLVEAKIVENSELLDLIRAFLHAKYLTEDFIEAVQTGTLDEASYPWIITGLAI